jgi:hypothetical protein
MGRRVGVSSTGSRFPEPLELFALSQYGVVLANDAVGERNTLPYAVVWEAGLRAWGASRAKRFLRVGASGTSSSQLAIRKQLMAVLVRTC